MKSHWIGSATIMLGLALGACSQYEDSVAAAAEAADAATESAASSALLSHNIFFRQGVPHVRVRNDDTQDAQVNQIIVNDLPGDPDCDQKSFETLRIGETREFAFPRCGVIRSYRVLTSAGEISKALTSATDYIFVSITSYGYSPVIEVVNQNSTAFRLERVVVNGRVGDTACDIKVFEDVPAQSRYPVPAPNCGSIVSVLLDTAVGEVSVNLEYSDPNPAVSAMSVPDAAAPAK